MNKSDAAKLLYIVKANYPKHFNNISSQDFTNLVFTWQMCLADYDYNLAQIGLKIFLSSETKGFPPTVGQIIDCVHKTQRDEGEMLTEMDAWGQVYKAICNSCYNAVGEFQKLSPIVQRVVGDPARLKEWALLDMKDVQTVLQSNFMRSFKAVQARKKEYKKMPNDIKQLLPVDQWSSKLEIIDMEDEQELKGITCSESDFIDQQMERFYGSI